MAIQKEKTKMPMQLPEERIHNFSEVATGYTYEMAKNEAARCLNCKDHPCVSGCPVSVNIPKFIQELREGNLEESIKTIHMSSSLPAICGRVCPQESQCESQCRLGTKFEPVAIGRLERFVADNAKTEAMPEIPKNGIKVAIIGSGPSGLACAGDLSKLGYDVTIFEALHECGGVLVYGIPEFRLPKAIVKEEVSALKNLGVRFETNTVIGKTLTIDDLFVDGYRAVFIGTGAGLPRFMGIPGENYNGVYSANEFLTRMNLMKAYKENTKTPIRVGDRVVVVGGGNVAMDAARTAKRLGADVSIVYRRSLEELPARREEVEHAMEEGIHFELLTNPTEIHGYYNEQDPRDEKNHRVTSITCVKMTLGEPDERGRRKPIVLKGSEFTMEADTVIMALGTSPNPLIKDTTKGLEINSHGGIIVNEEGLTSIKGIYAGGDAVTGAATVISAMGAGKLAASSIDNFFKNN